MFILQSKVVPKKINFKEMKGNFLAIIKNKKDDKVNSIKSDKGKFTVWIDGNEEPIVDYKGQTTIKKRDRCRIHSGLYANAMLTAVDKHKAQDSTVWLDAVAVAKTKKKLDSLIKKKDK